MTKGVWEENSCKQKVLVIDVVDGVEESELFRNDIEVHILHAFVALDQMGGNDREQRL